MEAATTEAAPRKLSLMELVAEYEKIFAEVDEAEGEVTESVGARLDAFNADFAVKCEAYALVITLRESTAEASKRVADTYSDRANRQQRSADALRQRLHDSLIATGRKKVETPTATIAIQANGGPASLVLTGPVPAEYTRTITEPDKAKIREALAEKKALNFAKLERGEHLRIR